MNDLQTQIARVRRRLNWQLFFSKLPWCLTASLVVAVLALVAGKFLPDIEPSQWNIAWLVGAVVVGIATAGVLTWMRRATPLDAAMALDHQFELAERVSSSVVLDAEVAATAAGQALVEDALQQVRRIELKGNFVYRPNRVTWLPLLPAAIAAAVIFVVLPSDPTAVAGPTPAQLAKQLQQVVTPVQKKLSKLQKQAEEKGLTEAKGTFKKFEKQANELAKAAPKDRKEAMAKLNDITKQMKQRREQLVAKDQLKDQMAGMKQLQQGPAAKLSEALKAGNMKEAAAELRNLQMKLAQKKMSEAERQELAKQLEAMSKQIEEMAKKQEENKKKLEQQIAAAEKAGQTAQKEKLEKELRRQESSDAAAAGAKMAKKLQAAAGKAKAGAGEPGSEMEDLAAQMEEMDMAAEEIAMIDESTEIVADARMDMAGDSKSRNGGIKPGTTPATSLSSTNKIDPTFKTDSIKGKPVAGRSFAGGSASGDNSAGATSESIRAEVAAAKRSDEDPVSGQRLSRPQRDFAKEYFDAIREGK